MNDDYYPPDKKALLDVIHRERQLLETLITELSESQLIAPNVEGNWSIKDIMAHISAWECLAQDRINAAFTGEDLQYPIIAGNEFVDKFNAEIYLDNKDKSIYEIRTEFRESHNSFLDQIRQLENEQLGTNLPFDWAGNLTVQVLISSNTHWHYLEHAESIEKWILSQN